MTFGQLQPTPGQHRVAPEAPPPPPPLAATDWHSQRAPSFVSLCRQCLSPWLAPHLRSMLRGIFSLALGCGPPSPPHACATFGCIHNFLLAAFQPHAPPSTMEPQYPTSPSLSMIQHAPRPASGIGPVSTSPTAAETASHVGRITPTVTPSPGQP